MRTNVTRLATFLGLSIAVIGLWASPAFAHGDWHHRDGGGVSGTQWDPNHDGHCDHDGTEGTSAQEKAADEAPEVEAEAEAPAPAVDDTALAVPAPEVEKVAMHAARPDALDASMTEASSNATATPLSLWLLAVVVLFGGAGVAVRYAIVRR